MLRLVCKKERFQPFETDFGSYIYVEKKGKKILHIIIPSVSEEEVKNCERKLLIRNKIIDKKNIADACENRV
jgi:hypothetical protein